VFLYGAAYGGGDGCERLVPLGQQESEDIGGFSIPRRSSNSNVTPGLSRGPPGRERGTRGSKDRALGTVDAGTSPA